MDARWPDLRPLGALRPAPLAALLAALLLASTPVPAGEPQPEILQGSSAPEILRAIRDLESAKDAKCQATATRLENFMYGTPLSEAARVEKTRLQKELIAELWRRASAAGGGEEGAEVGGRELEALLAGALTTSRDEAGGAVIPLAGEEDLVVTATDLRQYSSVAYSLRALLAVQQDALVWGRDELRPLSEEGIGALVELLDLRTLAALQLADRRARRASRREVSPELFRAAWTDLPGRLPAAGPSGDEAAGAGPSPAATPPGLPVLRAIIAEKVASYAAYNELADEGEAERLFDRNIQRFYARYRLPPVASARRNIQRAFTSVMAGFGRQLLHRAQDAASLSGAPVVRAPLIVAAAQEIAPHVVDDLEDAIFFPRLPRERRFPLESYDMDSFRDFGLHWKLLDLAVEGDPGLRLDLDPFAAEQAAEMIAQLGVLVFRIAGDIAREEGEWPFLTAEHVERAGRAIPVLARMDAESELPPQPEVAIASAPGSSPRTRPEGASFTDVTAAAGLTFRHGTSDWLSRLRRTLTVTPPTFSGGGAAAEDVDGDLLPDLLLVGGMGNALLLNDGRGGFRDATEAAGISPRRGDGFFGEARQPLIADFDNDGLQDILITYVDDPHRLYRNLGDGRFRDVTEGAGLGGKGLVAGPATALDFDRDGLLDLYIGYFGNYLQGEVPGAVAPGDQGIGLELADRMSGGGTIEYTGDMPTLSRDNRNALPNRLFRNLGGMRFQDVTEGSGAGDTGWIQAVSHTDLNLDGWQDLVVANDFGRNALLINRGDGTFEDLAERLGMTDAYHSMNVGLADLNLDSYPDIYISNINTLVKDTKYVLPSEETAMDLHREALADMRVQESSILYLSAAGAGELDRYLASDLMERGLPTVGWAWDADFFDFDNDGDDDLYVVNGANEYRFFDEIWVQRVSADRLRVRHLSHDQEANVLFLNDGGRLRNFARGSGSDLAINSRSAVYLDYDGDGDLDIAVNNFHAPAVLLRNNAEALGHNWLRVRLVGDPERRTTRDAIGARILATTPGGKRIWREVHGGSGYLSMEPKEQHFGLGQEEAADLRIIWPDGETLELPDLRANRSYLIAQDGEVRTLEAPIQRRQPGGGT